MTTSNKIILISPAWPYRGGIAQFADRFSAEMVRSGVDFNVFGYKKLYPSIVFPGKTQFSNQPEPAGLIHQELLHSYHPFNWLKCTRILKKLNPSVVIFRYWMPFFAPVLGSIARLLPQSIKKVALIDNLIPHEHRPFDAALNTYFLTSLDAAIVMATSVVEDLKQADFQKPILKSVHPIYDIYGKPISRSSAAKELKLDPDKKYVLFFGLVRKYKGLALLLDALSAEFCRVHNTHLIVAGEFYDNPDIYHRLIETKGLENYVHFFPSFIPDDEVAHFFSLADWLVQPYLNATQSGITQIAYHFGLPMIVTDVGGLPEMVPHGLAGLVCKPDKEALEKMLTQAVTLSKSDYENLKYGVNQKAKQFSWKNFAHATTHFLNEL